jgi:hypothetical protein
MRVIAPSYLYFHPCGTPYALLLPTGTRRRGAYCIAAPSNAALVAPRQT